MTIEVVVKVHTENRAHLHDIMLKKMKDEIELLSRHIEVARAVAENQPIGIMKLAELLDLPSHRIRYSLHVLEQLGYIRASSDGAVATERTRELFAHLNENLDDIILLLNVMKNPNSGTSVPISR